MDTNSIKASLNSIKELCNEDPEIAHSMEDKLYLEFIQEIIAKKHSLKELQEMADLILLSQELNFPRWCA